MRRPLFISIFNDVIGPVMRGPSSSHTAGSYHIGLTARRLLGEPPVSAVLTFDRDGSYAETYRTQSADLAFVSGFLDRDLTDPKFSEMLTLARTSGVDIDFRVGRLEKSDHPNMVRIVLSSASGRNLDLLAKSTGGGGFSIVEIFGKSVRIDGKEAFRGIFIDRRGKRVRLEAAPVFYPQIGEAPFLGAADSVRWSRRKRLTLGQAGRRYEMDILGLTEKEADEEMLHRFEIMKDSVRTGFDPGKLRLNLLRPSAKRIFAAEERGGLPLGGIPVRAAARALAVMHAANSGAVVCAAPTGGSSGVLPGALVTLVDDRKLGRGGLLRALFAAGAVGMVFARRATFAAEIAGCQVEIGAAGAMAAAAVVEAAGGSAEQACQAAAISLQNSMGSVCDLVAGRCEIPCHTRNASAAASAFLCADLILGGYDNPIPLDDTIDASLASGRMLPPELRVTSRGGLAVTPSARTLEKKRRKECLDD